MDEFEQQPQGEEALGARAVRRPHRPGQGFFEWLQMLLGCVLAAVVIFNCCARLTRVDGHSMDDTLRHGELMLIWSLGYQPKQGDIVVLNKTASETVQLLHDRAIVKRVIAVGGQSVDIDYTTSTVYVDGDPLDEPYILEEMYNLGRYDMQQTHWDIPDGSIFVMGDNRNHSTDSRHDLVGPIDTNYVLGKAILALWPLEKLGFL